MKYILLTACIAAFTSALSAQQTPTVYAESFRQGSSHVTEANFEAKLDLRNPTYRELIKDASGADRYELTLLPQIPGGDKSITSWRAQLADLRHKIYADVLRTNNDPSTSPKDDLGWLNPGKFAPVLVGARRVIKVDAFFVTIQVTAYHFTPLDSPYLDSMTVQIKFTNSDPRIP